MNGFFPNVEREQQSTAGPEHSSEFQKCLRQFLRCEVNNRVEGGNGSAGIIRYFERQHVALKKLNFWASSSCAVTSQCRTRQPRTISGSARHGQDHIPHHRSVLI